MMQARANNPVGANYRKPLVGMQKLSATALACLL